MEYLKIFLLSFLLLIMSCSEKNYYSIFDSEDEQDTETIDVKVMKWKDGHTAAVSITYDHGWGTGGGKPNEQISQDMVLERGLVLDYELLTATYVDHPSSQADLRDNQLPLGIHFYGHGHHHSAHDTLSFMDCLNSFRTCYIYMYDWGLNPKAYAYPHGSGRTPSTRLACKLAGFICARGFDPPSEDMYICPDDVMEPENWYLLPCVRASSVHNLPYYITNHAEMAEAVEKALPKTAWIILCYHAIGFEDGWGYYPFEDFEEDMDTIVENDFWCSNMDVIACYIKERSSFKFEKEKISSVDGKVEYKVVFRDRLENKIYDTPLTLDFYFNESFSVRKMKIEPALNGSTEFEVTDNSIRLNVVPDDREYRMTLLQVGIDY